MAGMSLTEMSQVESKRSLAADRWYRLVDAFQFQVGPVQDLAERLYLSRPLKCQIS